MHMIGSDFKKIS